MHQASSQNEAYEYSTHDRWEFEKLFTEGEDFFDSLLQGIRQAERSIELEVYIFESDVLGQRVVDELLAAAARGVFVRIIVDGIGSPSWSSFFGESLRTGGVKFRIYNRLPWQRVKGAGEEDNVKGRFFYLLRKLNRRTHRKFMVVDDYRAWLGSMNISAVHLRSVHADMAWRDTGVLVEGEAVKLLRLAFDQSWLPRRLRYHRRFRVLKNVSPLLRLNTTITQRRRNYRDLLSRIHRAEKKILLVTAYFVPTGPVVTALAAAAKRNVKVQIVVPGCSDLFFMPWVAAAFHYALLKAGAEIYEYGARVLHAKTLIIDDWATIGSSNFNHRSVFHDLEADVVISSDAVKHELEASFEEDLQSSVRVGSAEWHGLSAFSRFLGQVLHIFRRWL